MSDGFDVRKVFTASGKEGITLDELRDAVERSYGVSGEKPVRIVTTWRGTTIKRLTIEGTFPAPNQPEGTP